MHGTGGLKSLPCRFVLATGGLGKWKIRLTQGLDTWEGDLALGGPIAPKGS